jgi:hypothetical protein
VPGQSLTPLISTTEGIFDLTSNLGSREDAQRRAHDTQPPLTNMLSMLIKLICDAAKRALIIVRAVLATDTQQSDVQEAIRGLPNHLVVSHILRSEHFDDPADLARLPAVSRAMRNAVAETGLRFEELDEYRAAELRCLNAVQRLERGGRLSYQERLCQAAARGGYLEELKVLRANGCPWDERTCSGAAEVGHLEVLQWAHANRCPWNENTCDSAAKGGHLEVLQWARLNGCSWNTHTCLYAAKGGQLEVLQWLRANGCPWDKKTCYWAAQGRHLDILQWARANDCPWDETTCMGAAEGGHLETLQWARANGCPWDEWTGAQAAEGGHLEVLQWARANGCEWDAGEARDGGEERAPRASAAGAGIRSDWRELKVIASW